MRTDALCAPKWICWFSATISSSRRIKSRWKRIPIGEKNLFSINEHRAPSRKELRSFGLILAGGFLVIGIIPVVFRHRSPGRFALTLSLLFAVAGVLIPNVLRYLYRVWIPLGNILGWINSKIILGLLFYVVVTPVRFFMTLAGNDPMNRKFDPNSDTYRVVRKPREVSHMRHHF